MFYFNSEHSSPSHTYSCLVTNLSPVRMFSLRGNVIDFIQEEEKSYVLTASQLIAVSIKNSKEIAVASR